MLITDGLLSKQKVIPLADLRTAGADAVLVSTAEHLTDAKEWLNRGLGGTRTRTVLGKEVIAADGARIGKVSGLIADDADGDVRSLEVDAGRGYRTSHLVVDVDPGVPLDRDVIVANGAAVSADETRGPADQV
jgi:sporulation protein YlmC with PRC-barrel domain